MVEGHQVHRVAHAHRKTLLHKRFEATSPNKRFVEGAAAINDKILARIEAHGKNLFYFFAPTDNPTHPDAVVIRIHFGMSGAFRTHSLPGPQEIRDTIRLQLLNRQHDILAHVSAMSLEHGGLDFYTCFIATLGQDPLREDADPEALWQQVHRSRKPIGLVLMDQSMVAGPGNIYRAEILFKAGVHPEQPACSVPRDAFDRIWSECVLLLQRGFQTGSIVTVDPQEAVVLGKPWTRRYVYNQKTCGRCGSDIRTWDMATRTVYACETCQPLHKDAAALLTPTRRSALAAATPATLFQSHCAPDPGDTTPAKLSVAQLRAALLDAGLPTSGTKALLVARLEEHQQQHKEQHKNEHEQVSKQEQQVLKQHKEEQVSTGIKNTSVGNEKKKNKGKDRNGEQHGVEEQGRAVPATPVVQEVSRKRSRGGGLTVVELKALLKAQGLATSGTKAVLLQRLEQGAPTTPTNTTHQSPSTSAASLDHKEEQLAQALGVASPSTPNTTPLPAPGTAHVGGVRTAAEAAVEKIAAGEGRHVEHVALHTPASDAVAVGGSTQKRKRKRQ